MSALSIRLPDSLHERVRELAAREGISINQLIASALAEKLSALMTAEYLDTRAGRGARSKYLAALANVPDVVPGPADRVREAEPKNRTTRSKSGAKRGKAGRRMKPGTSRRSPG